ncbi:MAG: hypothetical protein ACYDBB_18305 [Armatimonadota bacterium]
MKRWLFIFVPLVALAAGVLAFQVVKSRHVPNGRLTTRQPYETNALPVDDASQRQPPVDGTTVLPKPSTPPVTGTPPRPHQPASNTAGKPAGMAGMPHRSGNAAANGQQRMGMEFQAKFSLMRLFSGIGRLEEEGKTPLTPAQAKAILAIMTPLRTQKTLTAAQAEETLKKLQAELTAEQRDAIDQMRRDRPARRGGERPQGGPPPNGMVEGKSPEGPGPRPNGGMGSPDGSPPGGRDGSRQPDAGRPGMSPEEMKNMNPFNPSGDNPMAERMAQRQQATFDALEAKAR